MITNIPKALPKLDLNITNRCNFHCIHCCFRSGDILLEELPYKKIANLLKIFKQIGGQRIDITGGEPLVRDDVEQIIQLGKNLGLKIELVTNGSLLDESRLNRLKQLGLDGIAISLDGSQYKIYKKIRPVSKEIYNRVISNIQKSAALGFYTKINTVVFNTNLADIPNITKLAINWGVKEHGLYYFTPVGRGQTSPHEVVNPLKWLAVIRRDLSKLKNEIKLSIETPILEQRYAKKCNISCYLKNPWHLQILPDGHVYPCAIMAFYNKPCGNLYHQTLQEIWHDKKLWDGTYYKKNVLPLFKKFGGCVDFGKSFKNLIRSRRFKFVCLMCKFKNYELYQK